MSRYEASIAQQQANNTISRRAYNALTYGIVSLCFLVTWGIYTFVGEGGLYGMLGYVNPILLLVIYLVGTIGGLLLMSKGKSDENLAYSIPGLVVFTLTFGGMLALLLTSYTTITISYAFAITACVSGIFLIAGVLFPDFFSSIGRIISIGLISLIVVELIAVSFFGIHQTIFDYIGIALFCGFLGYDSMLMASDRPSVPNAIFHAANIYLDIANILIRILNILNRD